MNERIRELAFKAACGMLSFDEHGFRLSETEAMRFALLIVRECARELDERTVFVRGVRAGTWIKNFMGIEE